MIGLEKVFVNKKIELQSQVVSILEVHKDEIKKINPQTEMGFIRSNHNGIEFDKIQILIDKDMPIEMKLNVMFHEHGHAKYWLLLGPIIIEERKKDDFAWVVSDEFEAFKNQLLEIKEVSKLYDIQLLSNLIQRLEQRILNENEDERYKAALNKLFTDNIWIECKSLLKNNYDA
jgi:hypothetical protein